MTLMLLHMGDIAIYYIRVVVQPSPLVVNIDSGNGPNRGGGGYAVWPKSTHSRTLAAIGGNRLVNKHLVETSRRSRREDL